MQVYFTVNVGRKFRDSSWCPLNREVVRLIWGPLDTGFTVEYFGYAYVLPSSFSKIGFML